MLTSLDKLEVIKLAKQIFIARINRGLVNPSMRTTIDATLNVLYFKGLISYDIEEFVSYKPETTFSSTHWFDPKDVKSRLEVFDLLIAQLSESPEYYVSQKKYYCNNADSDKITEQRLFQIWKLGLKAMGFGQFGIKGLMSGLYIERVWNYSEKQWDDYIEWIKQLKNEKVHA